LCSLISHSASYVRDLKTTFTALNHSYDVLNHLSYAQSYVKVKLISDLFLDYLFKAYLSCGYILIFIVRNAQFTFQKQNFYQTQDILFFLCYL
jgi:hypothetical protein